MKWTKIKRVYRHCSILLFAIVILGISITTKSEIYSAINEEEVPLAETNSSDMLNSIEKVFLSVEQLKMAELDAGDVVSTMSYYENMNKGGGIYRIYQTKPQKADDGICIALNNGMFAVLQIKDNMVSVSQYGAKGDGVTDDSFAINSAMCNAKHIIFFEDGVYLCKSSLISFTGQTLIGSENSLIRFENRVTMHENATGGLFTINGGDIIIKNLIFEYVSDEDTQFDNHTNGDDSSKGGQGVLVKIRSCSSALVDNCKFIAGGKQNPAICLMWLKAENGHVENVEILNSFFSCLNSNLVGGNLWVQGIDGKNKTVKNLWVHNNEFIKNGNDEILGLVCESTKGNTMENILIEDNVFTFVDGGTKNNVFITLGMRGSNNEFINTRFIDNVINVSGEMQTIITANNESVPMNGQALIIANNIIQGNLKTNVSCYRFRNAEVEVYGNTYDITSLENRIVYTTYEDGGTLAFHDECIQFDCNHVNYIASIYSNWFDNGLVCFENCEFYIREKSIKNEISNFQIPNSGEYQFVDCIFDTTKSTGNQDIVFQMITEERAECPKADIVIRNCVSSADWWFYGKCNNRNNKIYFIDSVADTLSFIVPRIDGTSYFNLIEIVDSEVSGIRCNRKESTEEKLAEISKNVLVKMIEK